MCYVNGMRSVFLAAQWSIHNAKGFLVFSENETSILAAWWSRKASYLSRKMKQVFLISCSMNHTAIHNAERLLGFLGKVSYLSRKYNESQVFLIKCSIRPYSHTQCRKLPTFFGKLNKYFCTMPKSFLLFPENKTSIWYFYKHTQCWKASYFSRKIKQRRNVIHLIMPTSPVN